MSPEPQRSIQKARRFKLPLQRWRLIDQGGNITLPGFILVLWGGMAILLGALHFLFPFMPLLIWVLLPGVILVSAVSFAFGVSIRRWRR